MSRDKKQLMDLIKKSDLFDEVEIKVAVEVVNEAMQQHEKDEYQIFCAVNGDEAVVGYICFGPIPLTEDCYEIYWIAVDRKLSRKGVGGDLLRFAEELLVKKKARRIYLDTSSTPGYAPARSFYEKHGYCLACSLESFYREGDHKMIFMKDMYAHEV
jgi:ribosomal protein S18 acetylase RimI-like enzyme